MTRLPLFAAAVLALAAASPAQTLVGHWRLDDPAGSATCAESSGLSSDGFTMGGVTLGVPGAAPGTQTAARFNATDGHVGIPAGPALDGLVAGFSVSAWLRVNDVNAGWRRVFGNQGAWAAGIWQNQLTFTTNGIADYFSGGALALDTWSHVVWTFDASYTVQFFVDGALKATVTGPAAPGAPGPTWYIATHEGSTHMFPGVLDDVQVYDGVVGADQVAYLFANPGAVLGVAGTPFCPGDGTLGTCPCGNAGAAGEGCANSTGAGALLAGLGTPSVSADVLTFEASGLIPGQPCLLFAGLNATNGGAGILFGDGLRCAGGSVVRLGVQTPDAGGLASFGPGLAAALGVVPGDLRRFQAWYRDPAGSPCGTGFNLSNGYEVQFGS